MKTLKLFIKTSFFNKINDFLCFDIIKYILILEEATKCLFSTSLKSTHSISTCFTISGRETKLRIVEVIMINMNGHE